MKFRSLEEMDIVEEEMVRELGDKIGYGNLMSRASKIWGKKMTAKELDGSEFSVGPCTQFLVPCVCVELQKFHCGLCCGTQKITKAVKKLLDMNKDKINNLISF